MSTVTDNRDIGFTMVENELIHNYRLNPMEGWLYVVLLSHVNRKTKVAFPGYGRLAALSGMSRASVRRVIQSLVDKGLINKTTHFNGVDFDSNEYSFNSLKPMVSQSTPMVSQTIPYDLTEHTPMLSQSTGMLPQSTELESLTKRNNQIEITSSQTPAKSPLEKAIRNRRAKP